MNSLDSKKELVIKVEKLKTICIDRATGNGVDDDEYVTLRKELINNYRAKELLPKFLLECSNTIDFKQYIQPKFAHYSDRRSHIRQLFAPLIVELERDVFSPSIDNILDTLKEFSTEEIHEYWGKAADRCNQDPEGAITIARTLLEQTCLHILYINDPQFDMEKFKKYDLPKLYNTASKKLNLSPGQHSEKIFKQILGGCHSIVQGLGALRTELGDAHASGPLKVKPSSRHAKLAVGLAGTMCVFLIETLEHNQKSIPS